MADRPPLPVTEPVPDPATVVAEPPPPRRILHPTDFSASAEQALAQARSLARALGAELVLLHVEVETPLYRESFVDSGEVRRVFEAQHAWAREALGRRAEACRAAGVPARALLTAGGPPHESIVATAEAESADLIVLGTHGRGGFTRWFMGSVADRVVRSARCPVLTVRAPEPFPA
jgi:nucleotide-binding universal stress UspA family protein